MMSSAPLPAGRLDRVLDSVPPAAGELLSGAKAIAILGDGGGILK